jgi:hypothetical protein
LKGLSFIYATEVLLDPCTADGLYCLGLTGGETGEGFASAAKPRSILEQTLCRFDAFFVRPRSKEFVSGE